MRATRRDVVIVGGGFYGCFVAYQIAARFPGLAVTLLEKEPQLCGRASRTNQGQLHYGYMYSADVELAAECVRNATRFTESFPGAVDYEVTAYFGIHRDSEIDPATYEYFCRSIDLPLRAVSRSAGGRFGDDVVAAFSSAERTFDAARLARILWHLMAAHGVEVRVSQPVDRIVPQDDGGHEVVLSGGGIVRATAVYNTTFADINHLHARSGFPRVPIRSEVFLHFLLGLPARYAAASASVIRGPFASVMPSTFRGGHLLAAAAHRRIARSDAAPPSETLEPHQIDKIYDAAMADCARYLPGLADATRLDHVVGTRAAFIDTATGETTSRVTPFLDFSGVANYHVILGGKVPCLLEAQQPALDGIHAADFPVSAGRG